MKTRNKSYKDYGFEDGEEKQLISFCKSPDFNAHIKLYVSCISANEDLSEELFYSLRRGVSYDALEKAKHIPLSKTDFYAYRRKALAYLKEKMKGCEK